MMEYGNGRQKPAYTYDYFGSCAPENTEWGFDTFTLGIFQWLPKSKGGTKRGKVFQRVKGYSKNPQEAYQKAQEIVERLNKGKDDDG